MRNECKQLAIAAASIAVMLVSLSADAQARRAKGWVREPAHVVATIPLMLRFRDYLPEEVDLSPKFPTPGNQGQQSSCTAWATGYAMRSYYEGRRRNWDFSSPGQIISPGYIYNRLHQYRGNCDTGSPISDALELLKTAGAPTLSAYPYMENDCSRPANPEQERSGAEFRISGWSGIDSKKLDDAKGQLARGNPVVFGMEVSDSFENLSGPEVYDDVVSPRTGGHAMVLVGYSERRQAFKVMNSWGTGWGEGGFGWISYRATRQLADLMFVMDVPDYVPPAPPRPEPPPPVVVAPPKPAPEPVVPPPAPKPPAPVVVPQPPPPQPAPVVVTPPAPRPPAPEPVVTPKPAPPPAPVVVTPEPRPPAPRPVVAPEPRPPLPVIPKPAPPVIVAPPSPQPVPSPKPPVTPSVAMVQKQLEARLREMACARVEGRIDAARTVRVSGFAGSAGDLGKLRSDLQAMQGVRRVESSVTVYPWPQCEVFLNF
ncbi:MAG: C1 family peptidase, partial [Proteobacteria bacterium]|nr:C1 family peptidase [Pseudomonadota bacterium]